MTPVCVYVDGFNLYHALARFKDDKVKWLDLATLADRLIAPKTEKVQGVFYFSAFAHWLPAKMARHQIYVKALEARGVTCVLGHFKNKTRWCRLMQIDVDCPRGERDRCQHRHQSGA